MIWRDSVHGKEPKWELENCSTSVTCLRICHATALDSVVNMKRLGKTEGNSIWKESVLPSSLVTKAVDPNKQEVQFVLLLAYFLQLWYVPLKLKQTRILQCPRGEEGRNLFCRIVLMSIHAQHLFFMAVEFPRSFPLLGVFDSIESEIFCTPGYQPPGRNWQLQPTKQSTPMWEAERSFEIYSWSCKPGNTFT